MYITQLLCETFMYSLYYIAVRKGSDFSSTVYNVIYVGYRIQLRVR